MSFAPKRKAFAGGDDDGDDFDEPEDDFDEPEEEEEIAEPQPKKTRIGADGAPMDVDDDDTDEKLETSGEALAVRLHRPVMPAIDTRTHSLGTSLDVS